jgi:hypothetical protein
MPNHRLTARMRDDVSPVLPAAGAGSEEPWADDDGVAATAASEMDPQVKTVPVVVPEVATEGGFGSWRCFLTVQQELADLSQAPNPWSRPSWHGPMWVTMPVDGDILLAASMVSGTLTTADLCAFTDDQIRQWVLSDVISVGACGTHDEMSTTRFADGYGDDPSDADHFRLLTTRIVRAFTLAGDPT